jgi:hypothetical protein
LGPVTSTATAWRVLNSVDAAGLAGLRSARAAARERAWLAHAELGRGVPVVCASGRTWPSLVIIILDPPAPLLALGSPPRPRLLPAVWWAVSPAPRAAVDLFRLFGDCLYIASQQAADQMYPPTDDDYENYVNACLGLD